jgi:farnesyl-diphosphate farnesyltransferase
MDDYCYYVAGVVGQMLTELFCGYSAKAAQNRGRMHELDVSFAQGLQMTNILKDIWEDRSRGACWLPQEVFTRHGIDLGELTASSLDGRFDAAMSELVGVAHAHLRNALAYTLLLPPEEAGMRRFCLWALGLAILTLRRIVFTPGFTSGRQVKVSHSAVAVTRISTNFAVRNDWMLRRLFNLAASGVPLAPPGTVRQPSRPALHVAAPSAEYGHAVRSVPHDRGARRSEGRSAL